MSVDTEWLKEFIRGEGRAEVERIGHYEIIRSIGEGGMSVVYEAYDPDLDRKVAVKVLRGVGPTIGALGPGSNPPTRDTIERLRREALAVARLRHPAIVAVHEVGDGFIVMDLVEGKTLADVMPELSIERRVAVLETVARAVAYAHGQGVVHRDLKPGNILVDPDGRVVLTDFGIAKVAGGDVLTKVGSIAGTPQYMAPEQVRSGETTAATDVWALGVLLYEMLMGRRPFDGPTDLETYERVARLDPPAPKGPLGAVAMRAMQKDPRRRYPSAEAFADELARFARGESVQAPRFLPWLKRHRLAVVALATIVVAAGGLFATLGRAGHGLYGEYFSDFKLRHLQITRIDPDLAFNWWDLPPHPSLSPYNFSVRWTGRLRADRSETTRLCLRSDDGARLWLDSKLVIDVWTDHASRVDCTSVDLVRGRMYDLKVEFYQMTYSAALGLYWERPSLAAPELVPAANFYLPAGMSP